jgi:hypothetical protein
MWSIRSTDTLICTLSLLASAPSPLAHCVFIAYYSCDSTNRLRVCCRRSCHDHSELPHSRSPISLSSSPPTGRRSFERASVSGMHRSRVDQCFTVHTRVDTTALIQPHSSRSDHRERISPHATSKKGCVSKRSPAVKQITLSSSLPSLQPSSSFSFIICTEHWLLVHRKAHRTRRATHIHSSRHGSSIARSARACMRTARPTSISLAQPVECHLEAGQRRGLPRMCFDLRRHAFETKLPSMQKPC